MTTKKAWHVNGFLALLLALASIVGSVVLFANAGSETSGFPGAEPEVNGWFIFGGIVLIVVFIVLLTSLTIVQPNQAKIITFFGRYKGTITESGLWLVVPFSGKTKVSLKVRNFNSQTLKVNDAEGNPIEIGCVVVFKVVDTAKAVFDVDNYSKFVEVQSETAIRHIAANYAYDTFSDEQKPSLRGNADEVSQELTQELQTRLALAGVEVLETRLTHLAYAPEIASAMLQRQQAIAIIAARQKIVEGAVTMVESALQQLKDNGIELDGERRAAMINNLMVTIVSDRAATPVINTGTMYG
ncbi:SPFH domain-containing protein [Cohnella sp. LGH]|uniref:Regulator of protease activity HflC (Stomatin/prohibitin superfamily) n=1 Tax=Cohnella phaseoli TaxID=456490 RepID=A0A3D9JSC2_9BACL|nr:MULTISPECIES: SPFH domain-containing protein [Cohnella]QTH43535.1 SPFH domain-containing protein [Cohnella sp. LGH]RED76326.1 regulator of protease activity HflC (stomatin/prohibitin superfamily) [Cohnella phaseoli]